TAYRFERLLIPGGFLFLETVGGQGRNYHQLPAPGELRRLLPRTLRLEEYRERKVGPADAGAVAVKLFAVKQARRLPHFRVFKMSSCARGRGVGAEKRRRRASVL